MKANKVIGILVVYYEHYLERALKNFSDLLKRVSNNHSLIVVTTNEDLLSFKLPDNVVLLAGDNSLREFSAWESGLSYCVRNNLLDGDCLVILGNDTFCHHNKFGLVTRLAFSAAFKEAARNADRPLLVGELHDLGYPFSIGGMTSSTWICTYLFALTGELFRRMGSLLPEDQLASIKFGHNETDFISGNLSANLASHVTRWLLGDGPASWYGSQSLTEENRDSLIGKAKSILCEKYVTAASLAVGATVQPVFSGKLHRQIRRLESLPGLTNPFKP